MNKMLRTNGFAGRLLFAGAVAALLPLGCTLITDVDRSKIPEPPAIEPPPPTDMSDAGTHEPEGDAGTQEPEDVPEAGAEPEPDSGSLLDAGTQDRPDAQVDGG